MAAEYIYVQVSNHKVVKIEPTGASIPTFDDLEDYDIVLNRLYEHGWELTNSGFQPDTKLSTVRMKREGVYSEPQLLTTVELLSFTSMQRPKTSTVRSARCDVCMK